MFTGLIERHQEEMQKQLEEMQKHFRNKLHI